MKDDLPLYFKTRTQNFIKKFLGIKGELTVNLLKNISPVICLHKMAAIKGVGRTTIYEIKTFCIAEGLQMISYDYYGPSPCGWLGKGCYGKGI